MNGSTMATSGTITASRSASVVGFVALLLASCTGKIGQVGSGSGSGGAGNVPGGGGAPGVVTGGGGATQPPPPPPPPPTTGGGMVTPEAAGPLALRRLTVREYNNTVADLFGDTTRPALLFPTDSPSDSGFVAPIEVSSLHAQRYEEASELLANAALAANKLTIPCTNPAVSAEATCARQFIQQTGRKVFRRPVSSLEEAGLTALFTRARELGLDFRQSLTQVVRGMLQAPGFIYHWELGPTRPAATGGVAPLTSYQVASRLSYFLWETTPDTELAAAADADGLLTADAVETQARRMLANPRAKNFLESFHLQWLLIENLENLQKSETRFPFFGAPLRESLAPGLTEFAYSIFDPAGDGTLKTLLTAPYGFVNSSLAPVYGVTATGTTLTRTNLDPNQRAGILTQATFLASRAAVSASNPIYRGFSVYKKVLCGQPRAFPGNVPDVAPEVAGKSTRDRYAAHAQGACAECHAPFDPLGFAFEHYDAVGAYRAMDGGKPVDATGTAITPQGATITFTNAVELVNKLADSDEVKWCATRNWFRYMLGRADSAEDLGSMESAYRAGAMTPGFSLRDMIFAAVRSTAFRQRTVSPTEGI